MREIVKYPSEILRKPAQEVSDLGSIKDLVEDMKEAMLSVGGIGIAAPQVGVSLRVIVVSTANGPLALVNPQLVKTSKKRVRSAEGCLSFPGLMAYVQRYESVEVWATNVSGEAVVLEAIGMLSMVLQHAFNPLDSRTLMDYLPDRQRKVYLMKRGAL
jgi:peptide deformylase